MDGRKVVLQKDESAGSLYMVLWGGDYPPSSTDIFRLADKFQDVVTLSEEWGKSNWTLT